MQRSMMNPLSSASASYQNQPISSPTVARGEEEREPLNSSWNGRPRQGRNSSLLDAVRRAFSIGGESILTRIQGVDSKKDPEETNSSERSICCNGGGGGGDSRFSMKLFVIIFLLVSLVAMGLMFVGLFRNTDATGRTPPHQATLDTATSECIADSQWEVHRDFSTVSNVRHGAVATDHELCSQMGLDILQTQGGNAVDAAVTVTLCLGVANPASSGLGGGAFMLIHTDPSSVEKDSALPHFVDARRETTISNTSHTSRNKMQEVIDCREKAPAAAFRDMYQSQPDRASDLGGLAIPVPGELKCLELAHARHGKLDWKQVVDPVVQLAQRGVVVNPNLAHEIQYMAQRYTTNVEDIFDLVSPDSYMRTVLTRHDDWNSPLVEGDIMYNPQLAKTLQLIRDDGANALYQGEMAAKLAKDIQDSGGIVTRQDIENYQATMRSPVIGRGISGVNVVGVPPPSSGGAAIVGALRFLSGFASPLSMFADTLSVHRQVEASKHAFAIRMSLSDPNYNSNTVADAVHDLVEGDYMEKLRSVHKDNTTLPLSRYGGSKWSQVKDTDGSKEAKDAKEGDRRRRRRLVRRFGYLNDHGTSHFSIVDADNNAVAMTTSVNTYFGANVYSPSTGILLSSTMDDFGNPGEADYFGLHPSEANFIEPGKVALSSMSPTMVFREALNDDEHELGDLMLVLGGSGGPKIISAVMSVIIHHIFTGIPLFESIAHPRVHDQLIYHGAAAVCCDHSQLHAGPMIDVSNRTRTALTQRGHDLVNVNYQGTVQAVSIDLETNEMTAACDIRKGGRPAGY